MASGRIGSGKVGMRAVGDAISAPTKMFGECCKGTMGFAKWTKKSGPAIKFAKKRGR